MGEMADFYLDCECVSYYGTIKKHKMLDFNLYVTAITDRASLCYHEGEDIWLPLSQIGIKNLVKNEFNDIKIPKWLCEIKGLING